MIEIKDLHVCVADKALLKGVNLSIRPGEIHVIMGPNGAGKSTLAKVLAGDPSLEVKEGSILFCNQNLLEMDAPQRSHAGLFVGFQYPVEIPGVTNFQFLHTALNAQRKSKGLPVLSEKEFSSLLKEKMDLLEIREEFKERNVNEGFSGGEKKRNEILQMAILNPSLAVLDETDSGLDIDALRKVATGLHNLMDPQRSLLVITHYQRLLDYLHPDHVHVMREGRLIHSGGPELALQLEEKGYDWL
jgi:Fe-S cluster assembly ATP-binding protein